MNWILGISVFFAIAKIGVFGLGYGDLEKMFYGGIIIAAHKREYC